MRFVQFSFAWSVFRRRAVKAITLTKIIKLFPQKLLNTLFIIINLFVFR